MTNLEDVDPEDEPRTLPAGHLAASGSIVILAGVTMHFLLAFVLMFIVIAGQGEVPVGPNTTLSS